LIGAGTNALKASQIEFDEFTAAAIGRRILSDLFGRGSCLFQITRRAHNPCTVGSERSRGFDADASRDAGNKDPLAPQIDSRQNIFCC
jgi:hypothetical protein